MTTAYADYIAELADWVREAEHDQADSDRIALITDAIADTPDPNDYADEPLAVTADVLHQLTHVGSPK